MKYFKDTKTSYFLSESQEDGKYIFEGYNFLKVDGRDTENISKLHVKDIRSDEVPQYILDELYHWSRKKGFWSGILKNVKGDGTTYWVKASIVKTNSKVGVSYGMISVPASENEIEQTIKDYTKLKNIKFNKKLGLISLRYALHIK
jgi:hypothetical protein